MPPKTNPEVFLIVHYCNNTFDHYSEARSFFFRQLDELPQSRQ